MNDDYISRKAVLKMIDDAEPMNWTDSESEIQAETDYDLFREMIEEQPATDVVEVKRGEWKVDETHDYEPYCSLCGHEPIAGEKYNYCPDCGAEMRGDSK